MDRSWPLSVLCQWWTSCLQMISALYVIVCWVVKIHEDPADFYGYRGEEDVGKFTGWLVFWFVIVCNDLFIMITDLERTNTYLGCIITQTGANICFVALIALHSLSRDLGFTLGSATFEYIFTTSSPRPLAISFGTSMLVAGLCSLCSLCLALWPVARLRSQEMVFRVWMTNTKDTMTGIVTSSAGFHTPSILGQPRETAMFAAYPKGVIHVGRAITVPLLLTMAPFTVIGGLSISIGLIMSKPLGAIYRSVKRFLVTLLFRRVRPVETRLYALSRNLFAIIAMGALVFRMCTALQKAQNEIGTRARSGDCEQADYSHRLSILSERFISGFSDLGLEFRNVSVLVSVVLNNPDSPREPYNITNCDIVKSETFRYLDLYQTRIMELFSCPDVLSFLRNSSTSYPYHMGVNFKKPHTFAYQIEVQPTAGSGEIRISQMPQVWFLNRLALPTNFSWSDVTQVREYVQPLSLLPGSHITSESNLITRRFITSSIVKDIILNSDPSYKCLSLYPIAQVSASELNASDTNIATAVIRPTLYPKLMYYRPQVDGSTSEVSPMSICDFIDDYRSSNILDVIGSVGGLFALLQAAHLLLFGRPLFWGLTGAMTISPFGLVGQCSSKSFKRRLREEYHVKSEEGDADTIRVAKFLQDFVIDFGPASLEPEQSAETKPEAPLPIMRADDEESVYTRFPSVRIESYTMLARHSEDENGVELNHMNNRSCTNSSV